MVSGLPLPKVSWWDDGKMLDGSSHPSGKNSVENILIIKALDRSYYSKKLTCISTNNNHTKLSTFIVINMICK